MNSQNPAKTSHHRVFSIVHEISKNTVSNKIALWFFRNLNPRVFIAPISEYLRDRISFVKAGKILPL